MKRMCIGGGNASKVVKQAFKIRNTLKRAITVKTVANTTAGGMQFEPHHNDSL